MNKTIQYIEEEQKKRESLMQAYQTIITHNEELLHKGLITKEEQESIAQELWKLVHKN